MYFLLFRFFKDRHWLFTEFPEIVEPLPCQETVKNILEIGCGVGNSVFPIVEHCKKDNVFVYGCDFSENAVNILKEHEEYNPDRWDYMILWNILEYKHDNNQCLSPIIIYQTLNIAPHNFYPFIRTFKII